VNRAKMPSGFYIYYTIMFMGVACNSFFSLFFQDVGMTAAQIGLLFGLAPLGGLLAQPMLGALTDRSKYKNYVLYLIIACNFIVILWMRSVTALWLLSVLYLIFVSLNNCLIPVQDTITLDYVSANGGDYAPVRMSGTLGYVVMAVIVGPLITGSVQTVLLIYLVLLALVLLAATRLPKVPGYRKKGQKHSILGIIREREMLLILLCLFFLYINLSFDGTFTPPYVIRHGGTTTTVGLVMGMRALSEIPFFLPRGRAWIAKMGVNRMMPVCIVLQSLRWLAMAAWPHPAVFVAAALLHGLTIVVSSVSIVHYINDHVSRELKASGQMAMTLFSVVLARFVGNVAGGALVDLFGEFGLDGARMVYFIMVPLAALVLWVWGRPLLKIGRQRELEEMLPGKAP
jgi:PPP family 3-phenylpropionic acid transporter